MSARLVPPFCQPSCARRTILVALGTLPLGSAFWSMTSRGGAGSTRQADTESCFPPAVRSVHQHKPYVRLYCWKRVGGDVNALLAIKLLKFS